MEFINFCFDELFSILFILYVSVKEIILKYWEQIERKRKVTGFDKAEYLSVIIPKSVNYHFTRVCNYSCGFCFHTAKTSYMLNLEDVKVGLQMLRNAGEFL